MKKIFINILFFLLITSNLEAHITHYKYLKKIELEIFRNNELIGYNNYFFTKNKDITKITNQFKFTVELLGATIFNDSRNASKFNALEDVLKAITSTTL